MTGETHGDRHGATEISTAIRERLGLSVFTHPCYIDCTSIEHLHQTQSPMYTSFPFFVK